MKLFATLIALGTIASVAAPASADMYIKNTLEGTIVNNDVTDLYEETIRVGYEKDAFFAEIGGGIAFTADDAEAMLVGKTGYEANLTDKLSLTGEVELKFIDNASDLLIVEPVVELKYKL